jgi:DNA ligase-1
VALPRIEFREGAVHLPELGLWLDAHEPRLGRERVFVSHAHSDHVAAHQEIIVSAPTAKLMQARMGGAQQEHVLKFGETRSFEHGNTSFQLTLLPAGHIFGSAMALIEAGAEKLLYTGDFKLRRSFSAELCEPRSGDILVMETTFGRPQYAFPHTDEVLKGVVRFCREALDNDETPVLFGYSLGKSQELLCGLGDAGLPLMLHGAVHRLTQIYEQFGQCFPKYERYEAGTARGKVLLCPPNVINSAMLRNLGKSRTAILTGWAVDPNCRYRYQCDAAFPLSDHADFPDLLNMVERVQPKKVLTLHGFAADFAQTLRERGYDAQALSEQEQFALALEASNARQSRTTAMPTPNPGFCVPNMAHIASSENTTTESQVPNGPATSRPDAFYTFTQTCSQIAADNRKLEKVRILSAYLRALSGNDIIMAATWMTGRPFPASQNKVLQLGWAVLRDALCAVGETTESALHQVYLKHSDLGETAAEVLQTRPVTPALLLKQVRELFEKIQAARGPLAKTPLLVAAFRQCTALEAKYLVKIITGDLRIGLKEGLVEEAVAQAFEAPAEDVRQANLLLGDIGATARLASEHRLNEASLTPFQPVKFMLASPEETAADILKRIAVSHSQASSGSETSGPANPKTKDAANIPALAGTVWLEDKYDGIRCQLHKVGPRVDLYSRDLKEITATFPELADAARKLKEDVVLDGEIVAMRGEEVLPFAELQKRLGRREADLFMREEVPIQLVAFDLLWLAGETLMDHPLVERRQALEALEPLPAHIRLARITRAVTPEEIEAAFNAAQARGNEGLVIKDPASPYSPGRRGLAWLKLKKPLATLDCVVVGAEYGHGKRNKVLSDYTFAVRDESNGELKIIGKAYTGLTDVEIAGLTEHFLNTATHQHGRYFEVPPDTVLEIAFDRIQPSTRHNSGLALRFPRIVRIRADKSVAEIDTLRRAQLLTGVAKR